MPGDPFRKVRAGERLHIPAEAWNACLDAARWVRQQQYSRDQETGAAVRRADIVRVKNQSGSDRARFDVLGINEPIILPSEHLREAQRQVALEGVIPTAGHYGRYVVLLEPIPAGAIGLAVAAGVTLARLLVTPSQLYEYADIGGVIHALVNVPHGSARVLWMEEIGSSERWAVVRLGDIAPVVEHVMITSNVPDSEGLYDGMVQRYDVGSRTWQDAYPCKVLDINI